MKATWSVKEEMVQAYFKCHETHCDDCALNDHFEKDGERIMFCVLFTEFTDAIFDKMKENLTR